MTTALFVLRAVQLGLTLEELNELEQGFIIDMMIEASNDNEKYSTMASQSDFDAF